MERQEQNIDKELQKLEEMKDSLTFTLFILMSFIINIFNIYPIFKLFEGISGRADDTSESKVRLNIIYGAQIAIVKEIIHMIYVLILEAIGFGDLLYIFPIFMSSLKIGWYCAYMTTLRSHYFQQVYNDMSRINNQNKLWGFALGYQ